jgi:hypothetical protein
MTGSKRFSSSFRNAVGVGVGVGGQRYGTKLTRCWVPDGSESGVQQHFTLLGTPRRATQSHTTNMNTTLCSRLLIYLRVFQD